VCFQFAYLLNIVCAYSSLIYLTLCVRTARLFT